MGMIPKVPPRKKDLKMNRSVVGGEEGREESRREQGWGKKAVSMETAGCQQLAGKFRLAGQFVGILLSANKESGLYLSGQKP